MRTIPFLSENNETSHRAYLKELYLKLSILQKSDEGLADLKPVGILLKKRRAFPEAVGLSKEILLHEAYFSSFLEPSPFSFAKGYRDADLRYGILASDDGTSRFLILALERLKVRYAYFDSICKIPSAVFYHPFVAIDLCEHAYFADFGFDRHAYLRAAVSGLDFSSLEKIHKKDIEK